MPDGATHAVLSVDGNDAVQGIEVLDHPSQTVAGALSEVSRVVICTSLPCRQIFR